MGGMMAGFLGVSFQQHTLNSTKTGAAAGNYFWLREASCAVGGDTKVQWSSRSAKNMLPLAQFVEAVVDDFTISQSRSLASSTERNTITDEILSTNVVVLSATGIVMVVDALCNPYP
eukprot:5789920-Pleurochrysis_carterae.AAC.3